MYDPESGMFLSVHNYLINVTSIIKVFNCPRC